MGAWTLPACWQTLLFTGLSQRGPASNKLLCRNPICKQMKSVTSLLWTKCKAERHGGICSHTSAFPEAYGKAPDEPPSSAKTVLTPWPQMTEFKKEPFLSPHPILTTLHMPETDAQVDDFLKYWKVCSWTKMYKELMKKWPEECHCMYLTQPPADRERQHKLEFWCCGSVRPALMR